VVCALAWLRLSRPSAATPPYLQNAFGRTEDGNVGQRVSINDDEIRVRAWYQLTEFVLLIEDTGVDQEARPDHLSRFLELSS